jgi:hypothetical protein
MRHGFFDDDDFDRLEQDRALDEARASLREEEGRCGGCGAFQGPNHICPHIQQLRNQVLRQNEEALKSLKAHVGSSIHPGMTCAEFDDMIHDLSNQSPSKEEQQ